MGEHKLIMGKDIYFWNFIILMIFTLFEVGASSLKRFRNRHRNIDYGRLGHPYRRWNCERIRYWSILHAPLGRSSNLPTCCTVPNTVCSVDALGYWPVQP